MKIAFAGPRPSISHTGIDFEFYRPDKYIYFQDLFHLFILLEEVLPQTFPLLFRRPLKIVSSHEILVWIHHFHQTLEDEILASLDHYEKELKKREFMALENSPLTNEEKTIFQNNLTIMHDYRIQRASNKIVYGHMIDAVCDKILEKKIYEIAFLFEPKIYHIVEAIAHHIAIRRLPLRYNIILKENHNGNLMIYLIFTAV